MLETLRVAAHYLGDARGAVPRSPWKWLVICSSDGSSAINPQGLNQTDQGSNHSSTPYWPMALDKSQGLLEHQAVLCTLSTALGGLRD